ncbi:hypothetical protein [Parabacteroides goldsteinii]|uniref:hypothetical protein n=1 Tax=Parabacteroides goldsteinii TaxID=328812 RepID=UPI0021706A67|nr:hypothetical protein [Parabacteroides goldsteinii]MCI9642618.1 hypothetical protein [Eubacterium sp.]
MTNFNIVFDEFSEDVDIIAIPDELVPKIGTIGQEFLYWILDTKDSDYWEIIDGLKYCIAETKGFIKWLNSNYCANTEKAYIVAQNTNYNPEYQILLGSVFLDINIENNTGDGSSC